VRNNFRVYRWLNGNYHEGMHMSNQNFGYGLYSLRDGRIKEGVFRNGYLEG